MSIALHIGLIINPIAGLGGAIARKGSDGAAMRAIAAALSEEEKQRARQRAVRALDMLVPHRSLFRVSTWAGDMGEDALVHCGISADILGAGTGGVSTAQDTRAAAATLLAAGVDLILFVGGDGTARDILDVVGLQCPVLGIPAGVKMHSAVFAVSPEAAGELLLQLARGGLVNLVTAEVRDIDEEAMRAGNRVRSRYYGELRVPGEARFMQHTKVGGREDASLVAADIAAWLVETMEADRIYLIGPGSTTFAIKEELGIAGTLLGVDAVRDGQLLAGDADENTLADLLHNSDRPASIIVTVIGGQGHVFGRGNQQLSPQVLRLVGLDNIRIVAAKSKIAELHGRPLLSDSNDPQLDTALAGYREIITGYDDHILYPLGQS